MSDTKYPVLFTPLRVRGTYFRNRIFSSPQGCYNNGPQYMPGMECAAFYERKAMGGFASVCVGDCIVEASTGKNLPFLIDMENIENLPYLAMTATAITRHGAIASAELSHDGMFSVASQAQYGSPLYGPVECDSRYGHVEEMPEHMILRLIDKFGKAAAFAKRCGFTMITIHAGHGWLPAQFMSSKVNTRKDKWGGSFENRMRFPLAVVECVRKAIGGDMPIECRFSGSEVAPEGYDLDEGVDIAKALDGKVDILHVSAGIHEIDRINTVVHPSLFLEDGCNSKYAREVRKHVKQSVVATVGAFTDPAHMEDFLASGGADIIAMARQTMADPDFPIKARSGRDDEIARCLRCNKCADSAGMTRIYHCSLNPEIGFELDVKLTPPIRAKKKVLVVGGGIGGMEAAIQAAGRGHEVILCEKTGQLGGILNCQKKVPFKKNLTLYLERQKRLLEINKVNVLLNTEVSPLYAKSVAADVIIAALGARPIVPGINGIEAALGAEEVFLAPDKAKGRIAVLGAGLVGIELAIWLAQLGHAVDIIEMANTPGVNYNILPYFAYRFMMDDLGIGLHLGKKAVNISQAGVDTDCGGVREHFLADTVIYAVGQAPLAPDTDALALCAAEFHVIGDCLRPGSILDAARAGFFAARGIGRV